MSDGPSAAYERQDSLEDTISVLRTQLETVTRERDEALRDKEQAEQRAFRADTFRERQRELVEEFRNERDKLQSWKDSAMSVWPDMQAIGDALGLTLGVSVHDKIVPGILSLRQQLAAQAWQPIETAPRDETRLLAIIEGSDTAYAIFFGGKGNDETVTDSNGECWRMCWDYTSLTEPGDRPLFWQPLPPPPAITSAMGKDL